MLNVVIMALIECNECGKKVSNKASSCPNCGCPINEHHENYIIKEKKSIEPKKIFIILFLLIAVVWFGRLYYIINTSDPTLPTSIVAQDDEIGSVAYDNGYKCGIQGHINFPLQSTFRMWWDKQELGDTDDVEVRASYKRVYSLFEDGYTKGLQNSKITTESKFWKGKHTYPLNKMYNVFYDLGKNIGKDGKEVNLETLFSMFYIENFGRIDNDSDEPIFVEKLFEQFKSGYEDGKYSNY